MVVPLADRRALHIAAGLSPLGRLASSAAVVASVLGAERLRRLGNPMIERLNSDGAVDGAPPGACEERISSGCGPTNYSASA